MIADHPTRPAERLGLDPDRSNAVPMRIEVRGKAWAALMAAIPSAFTSFTRTPELVAIDLVCISDPSADVARALAGVPNAWMAIGGAVTPYIPDVTGPGELARDLWSVGNEMAPSVMGGGLNGCLDLRFSRQSLLFTRDFAILRDAARLDRFALDWDGGTIPVDALLHGFCGTPETSHGVLALHRRIRANAHLYTDILSSETGVDFAPGAIDIVQG